MFGVWVRGRAGRAGRARAAGLRGRRGRCLSVETGPSNERYSGSLGPVHPQRKPRARAFAAGGAAGRRGRGHLSLRTAAEGDAEDHEKIRARKPSLNTGTQTLLEYGHANPL